MKLKCLIRNEFVSPLPEEIVRQGVLRKMIDELGYPASHLVVEQELSKIPLISLTDQKIPNRRVDILCYAKGVHPKHELYPLLMIECKAIPLNAKVIKQVVGYNHYVKAPFLAVLNQNECQTGWFDKNKGAYTFSSGLPGYLELKDSLN